MWYTYNDIVSLGRHCDGWLAEFSISFPSCSVSMWTCIPSGLCTDHKLAHTVLEVRDLFAEFLAYFHYFGSSKKYAYELTLQNCVVHRTKPASRSMSGCGFHDETKRDTSFHSFKCCVNTAQNTVMFVVLHCSASLLNSFADCPWTSAVPQNNSCRFQNSSYHSWDDLCL